MDFGDPRQLEVFFAVHRGLPREGPGDRASLCRALGLAGFGTPPLNTRTLQVLDIGCGPGLQTLGLAEELPNASILAIDAHPPFVEELERRAALAGCRDRVHARVGDMAALELPAAGLDLIWCEGAAYIMGFQEALEAWRPLLRSGGRLAVTEAAWLRGGVPERARRMWEEYPAMTDVAGCRDRIGRAGGSIVGEFVLPESAWWDDYYTPMELRLEVVRQRYVGDPVAAVVLAEVEEEIAVRREHSDCYGYVFFVLS